MSTAAMHDRVFLFFFISNPVPGPSRHSSSAAIGGVADQTVGFVLCEAGSRQEVIVAITSDHN
jgi:hypothetical protein